MLPFNDEAQDPSLHWVTNRHSTRTSTLTQGQAKGTGWLLLPLLLGEFQCLSDLGGNKAMSSEQPRQGKDSLAACRATMAALVLRAPLMGLSAQRLQFLHLHLSSP